jgi:hypothetical protein
MTASGDPGPDRPMTVRWHVEPFGEPTNSLIQHSIRTTEYQEYPSTRCSDGKEHGLLECSEQQVESMVETALGMPRIRFDVWRQEDAEIWRVKSVAKGEVVDCTAMGGKLPMVVIRLEEITHP